MFLISKNSRTLVVDSIEFTYLFRIMIFQISNITTTCIHKKTDV